MSTKSTIFKKEAKHVKKAKAAVAARRSASTGRIIMSAAAEPKHFTVEAIRNAVKAVATSKQ